MPKKLKVYGWIGWRREAGTRPNNQQTREIVAATSMAEVGRIIGTPHRQLFNLGETGNPRELEVALAEPGVVFWRPLDDHTGVFGRGREKWRDILEQSRLDSYREASK